MSGAADSLLPEMLAVAVLHHVLHSVSPPATDPAEDEETVVPAGSVAGKMLQHDPAVREQNVETAQLAVEPLRRGESEKII